jgi:nitronate monooxygenase
MNLLKIGNFEVRYPIVQGGMGVRISGGSLAGHVARCGGVGVVAAAGIAMNSRHFTGNNYLQADTAALKEELRKAYEIAPELTCHAPHVALIPIVSSVRAAQLIAKKWDKGYGRFPDAVIVEDPDTAGGHLGEKLENIGNGEYDQYCTVRAIRDFFLIEYGRKIPVIAAGGIWDRSDMMNAFAQGADAVQLASRFVATVECDADDNFKKAYLECRKEDIGLVMSPAGLPGRGIIRNREQITGYDRDQGTVCSTGCLKKCTYKESGERFCIVKALDRAQRGDVATGLVFCGTNAYKADRIATVQEIFDELFVRENIEEAA